MHAAPRGPLVKYRDAFRALLGHMYIHTYTYIYIYVCVYIDGGFRADLYEKYRVVSVFGVLITEILLVVVGPQ